MIKFERNKYVLIFIKKSQFLIKNFNFTIIQKTLARVDIFTTKISKVIKLEQIINLSV